MSSNISTHAGKNNSKSYLRAETRFELSVEHCTGVGAGTIKSEILSRQQKVVAVGRIIVETEQIDEAALAAPSTGRMKAIRQGCANLTQSLLETRNFIPIFVLIGKNIFWPTLLSGNVIRV